VETTETAVRIMLYFVRALGICAPGLLNVAQHSAF
jgi:hypothetical protein